MQDAAQPGRVFVSTNVQNAARGAQHGRRPRGGDLGRDTAGFVRLRIEGTPDRITLSYDAGAGLQSVGTLSAASTGNALASWDYLSEGLAGKRVGLFAGLGGGPPATTPARYDYLSTDLNVIPEPGSAVLLVAAALPLMGLARRRWRRA